MKTAFLSLLFYIGFLANTSLLAAQAGKLDSLLTELKNSEEDTNKVNILINLCRQLHITADYEQGIIYANKALVLSEKINFKKGNAFAYNQLGNFYSDQGNYTDALKNHFQALKIREEIRDKKGIAASYNNIGLVYADQGNYTESLKNYLLSLKINEELGDKKGIAYAYNNIGLIYATQGNYSGALKNHLLSLKIKEEIGDKKGIANSYSNIGKVYVGQGNYSEALKNQLQALKIREEIGDKMGMTNSYNNTGNMYFEQGNYPEALKNYLQVIKIAKEIGAKGSLVSGSINLGKVYSRQNKMEEAQRILSTALAMAKEIGSKDDLKESYKELADVYSKAGNYEKAYEYQSLHAAIKDTLLNKEKSKQLAELQTQFETEKKEKEIELLTKDMALQEIESNKQKFIRNGFIGGLVFVLLLALLIYNRYVTKQKLNALLRNKNNELIQKNSLIEKQKEKIIDSIVYAQRIQQSILTDGHEIKKHLPDSFIYNQPKDIVSGDFYWFSKVKDKIIITAIDCTGHGVSGAFMSMIGNTLLNQIVNEKGITTPSEILAHLNTGVYNALHQDKQGALSHDGMDMALCSIDPKNGVLEYAGAQNPLYVVSGDNKVEIINAGLYTIGGGLAFKKDDPLKRDYPNHTLSIKKGMSVYLFSDGYIDQFGGDPGKKFGKKRFEELLIAGQRMGMEKQKDVLARSHQQWKGNNAQTDDVLVIGIRF